MKINTNFIPFFKVWFFVSKMGIAFFDNIFRITSKIRDKLVSNIRWPKWPPFGSMKVIRQIFTIEKNGSKFYSVFRRQTFNKILGNPDRNLGCRSRYEKVGLRKNGLQFGVGSRNGSNKSPTLLIRCNLSSR